MLPPNVSFGAAAGSAVVGVEFEVSGFANELSLGPGDEPKPVEAPPSEAKGDAPVESLPKADAANAFADVPDFLSDAPLFVSSDFRADEASPAVAPCNKH